MSTDRYRADEVAHDAIPRCRKAHLARWWEHWSGDLRPPMRADEEGAAYVLVAWDGKRIVFYPDGPETYRIAEPNR